MVWENSCTNDVFATIPIGWIAQEIFFGATRDRIGPRHCADASSALVEIPRVRPSKRFVLRNIRRDLARADDRRTHICDHALASAARHARPPSPPASLTPPIAR